MIPTPEEAAHALRMAVLEQPLIPWMQLVTQAFRERDRTILSLSATDLQDFYKATFPRKKLASHTGCRFV